VRSRLLAEFDAPEALLEAAKRTGARRGVVLDAFTPYRVEGLREALGRRPTRVARAVLAAGATGALTGYLVQWWTNAVNYPTDTGGRPPHSAPAFVPITFETMVLFAGITAVLAVFVASRLPRLWQPLFEVEGFERASIDRYFLQIDDPQDLHDADELSRELLKLGALRVVTP
jgi:hypothetical protein